MLVVNLFAGPGAGKSTTAAAVFALLKIKGYKAEYAQEYAKDLFWEGRDLGLLQTQILGKQHHRISRLKKHGLDAVVTDSPVMLGTAYSDSDALKLLAEELHADFKNMNFFIVRKKAYMKYGRGQTEEEARVLDEKTRAVLNGLPEGYTEATGDREGIRKILRMVVTRIKSEEDHKRVFSCFGGD